MTTTSAAPAATASLSILETLRRATTGPVLLPGDPAYLAEVAAWNTKTSHRPAIVVGAASADDVVAAVRHSIRHRLPIAVQATGHGAGTALDGGILVTTRRMTGISVDPRRGVARIAAGAKWAQVIAAAAPYGLAPLSGSASDVGAVGYTVGGGLGPLGRRYGFAADRVRSVEIVTGDGRLRAIGADDDTGLFWGIRGGKGNFGIVTALDVDLVPVARLYGGGIFFAGEHAASVLHAWRTWVAGVPEEMTSSVALLRLPDADHVPPPLRGRLSVHLRIAYVGDAVIGGQLVAPMRGAAPALMDTVRDMAFTETDSIHMDPVEPLPVWSKGALLSELTPAAVEALLDTAGPNVEVPLIVTEVRHMGGALARPPSVPNAVSGRTAAFSVFAVGPGVPGLEQGVAAAAHRVLDALAPWQATERLLNFLGPEENAATAYPPDIAARLQELKGRFDPHALFRHGHTLTAAPDAVRQGRS